MSDDKDFEDEILDDELADDAEFDEGFEEEFEELDDDLGDEWDDVEDVSAEDGVSEDSIENMSHAAASGEKTFLQKNFSLIVGAIVVVGGGLFGYAQFGDLLLGSQTAPPAAIDNGEAQGYEVVDTPQGFSDDVQASPTNTDVDAIEDAFASQESEGVLTPMPDFSASGTQTDILPDIDLNASDAPVDLVAEAEIDLNAGFDAPQDAPVQSSQDIDLDAIDLNFDPRTQIAEDLVEEPLLPAVDTPYAENAFTEDIAVLPDVSAPKADFQAELAAKDSEILNLKMKLNDVQSQSQSEIASLNSVVSSLEAQIAALEKQAKKTVSPAPSKPTSKPTKVQSASTAKSKIITPKAQPKPIKKALVKWQLRSAQPGKALISQIGSSDVRSVEVGDRVSGLGRITSVAQEESGLWVVRGTSGFVRQ